METEQIEIRLAWGCLCDPLSKQLKEQGIELPKEKMKYIDKLKEACNMLTTLVPDSVNRKNYEKANKRVMEIIDECE